MIVIYTFIVNTKICVKKESRYGLLDKGNGAYIYLIHVPFLLVILTWKEYA